MLELHAYAASNGNKCLTCYKKINADDNITLEANAGIAELEAFLAEAALATA